MCRQRPWTVRFDIKETLRSQVVSKCMLSLVEHSPISIEADAWLIVHLCQQESAASASFLPDPSKPTQDVPYTSQKILTPAKKVQISSRINHIHRISFVL